MRRSTYAYRNYIKSKKGQSYRIDVLFLITLFVFVIIVARLFQLQIIRHKEYVDIAKNQHFGLITLPAKRGQILVRDTHSGELSKLATNTTLKLLYVDPMVVEDKVGIAKKLAPLLFTKDEYETCKTDVDNCAYDILEDDVDSVQSIKTQWVIDKKSDFKRPIDNLKFKSYLKMVDEVAAKILRKISKTEVDYVVLKNNADQDIISTIINSNLAGIFADIKTFTIYADPTLIPESQLASTSKKVSDILNDKFDIIESKLSRRKVRYVFLKNKLEPLISNKIKDLNLKGVVMLDEHWRYYPEHNLASNIVGFLNRDKIGQYGIEGYFNTALEGVKGTIYSEQDPLGRQITIGDSKIVNPVDGQTIVLTIDRIIQKKVEEILKESVERFKADSGQVVIMDPFTGAIIAMANYPNFDPNNYTDVFELVELNEEDIENMPKTIPVFKLNDKNIYIPIEDGDLENENIQKYIYKNKFGQSVFKNKVISEYYEPGSVFKPIIMSIAIDAKEVEPQTTFIDDGPIKIDEFEIKNSDNKYRGRTTMSEVLAHSMNTGMSFVAKKLGKKLMYRYLIDFGFGDYTNIKLEGESKANLDFYKRWSTAQMLTSSFGQGIVVTPIQLITAWAALANGGKLLEPYIIDSIITEKGTIKTEPQIVRRVISESTSSIITSMSINAVENGVAKPAAIPGYLVAGKTGTSQIAGSDGKYETGDGSTITSFAGYAPALSPKFVILVKFDRPRYGINNTWGATTAAPVFKKISEFLFDYYNIPANS